MLAGNIMGTWQQGAHRWSPQHKPATGLIGDSERHVGPATRDQPEVKGPRYLGVFFEPPSHVVAIDTYRCLLSHGFSLALKHRLRSNRVRPAPDGLGNESAELQPSSHTGTRMTNSETPNDVGSQLLTYINTELSQLDEPVELDTDLLISGALDSLAVMQVAAWMEDELKIEVDPVDIVFENFQTVEAMATFVHRQR